MARKTQPAIDPKLLDALLEGRDPASVLKSEGLLGDLKKALAERMLNTEMDVHLDSDSEQQAGNHRNGHSEKTVLDDSGAVVLSIPLEIENSS